MRSGQPGRVVVTLDPLGGDNRMDQFAALRWAVERARADRAELLILCPLRLPVGLGLLPEAGPVSVLREDAAGHMREMIEMLPATLREGLSVTVWLPLGSLAAVLPRVLTRGDVLVIPPADRKRRRWRTASRSHRTIERIATTADVRVVRAAYASKITT